MKYFLSRFSLLTLVFATSLSLSVAQTITWTKTSGPYGGTIADLVIHPTNGTVYGLAGYNNNGGSIFRSTDGGSTWAEHKPIIFASDLGYIRDLEMLADGTILAAAPNNLYKSTDDGTTWTKINTGTSGSSNGFDQAMRVTKNVLSGTFYIAGYDYSGGNYKIFRSTNSGSTWTKSATNGLYVSQMVTASNGDVYVLSSSQIYKSTDDGVTFNTFATPDAANVYSLAAKSNGNELVVVTSSSNMYTLSTPFSAWSAALTETGIANATYSSSAVVAYSADNSTMFLLDNQNNKFYSRTSGNWTAGSTAFVTSGGENAIAFTAKDGTTMYVGTDDIGIYKSINGGAGWTEKNTGIESSNFNSIVAADNGNLIVAGQRSYLSTDNGASWAKISNVTANGYFAFKATTGSPKPIVLLGQSGQACYRSTDNGATWGSIAASPNASNYASADGTKILGYNNSQFFFSSNQGTSWSAAITITGTGWPSGSFGLYNVAIDQNSDIYVYMYDYTPSTYKFFKITLNNTTTPTTGTATQISLSTIGITGVNAIGYLNNKVYVTGYNNSNDILSSTSNSGTTWTSAVTSFYSYRIDSDPVNNYLLLTSSNNNTYNLNLSRDGGSTFVSSTVNSSSSKAYLYGYAVNASGVAFAGLSNSSVYTSTNTIVIPAAPSALLSYGATSDRLSLGWVDNATNETRFIIEKFNGVSYDSISYKSSNYTTGAKVFAEITNLQPNTSYTFRVYAKNSAGNSSAVSITLSTLNQCASSIPDNRSWNGTVTTVPAGTNTLTNISIKSKGNGQYSISDVVNGPIPTQGTTVYPEVFFENCNSTYLSPSYPLQSNGNGSWTSGTNTLVLKWITSNGITPETTATVTLTVNGSDPTPAAPTNTSAYVYNSTGVEISWVGSAFETQFVIERSKDNAFATIDRTFNVNYPATSAVDNSGLVIGTTYYYRVSGKNNAGTSTPSNTATVVFTKPYFVVSGTTVESTAGYSTTGAIWGDFNNDGFDDLIMPQLNLFNGIKTVPLSFKNDGAGNFTSIAPAGIVPSTYLIGTAADYNNDGKLDLFLTSTGSQNYLYKGNGDFTFSLIASTPVSENFPNSLNYVDFAASWVDYNKDGMLDLYVTTNANTKDAKLFTQGPIGTFTKETTSALTTIAATTTVSVWADYDNDGDQDVFITDQASSTVNQLYKNNGNGTFTRVTGAPFDTDTNQRSFTAAWGDYNNDTFLDLFIAATGNNLLYKNNGNGTFTKQSMPSTITETSYAAFAGAWGDINNDGYLDLLVSNRSGENQFYINNNGTSFTKINNEKINDAKVSNFGAALADYNNDGYLDIALAVVDPNLQASGIKNQLFKNNFNSGNWSQVKLVGVTSNKSAIGARITLVSGGKTQIREIASTVSFTSQPSLRAHFGIGGNTSITSIQVKWPSGLIQTYSNPPINQILTIVEDNQGPVIAIQSPSDGATGVATTTTIELTLNEASTAVASKNLVITGVGDSSPTATLAVTSAVTSGNKFTFTLPSKLLLNKQYAVALDAGAFSDIYGNTSLAVSSGWIFTTSAGPTVSSLTPAHNSTGISAATTLAIQFNTPVTAVTGKNVLLYDKSNLTTPVATLASTAGVIAGNTVTYTLASKLNRQTVYVVSVDAGAFIDAASNDFAGLATTAWEFTTDPGPSITTFLPANNATNVDINASIEITFNKAVTAVAGKNIKVLDGANVVLDVPVSTTGSLTGGGKYKLTPATSLPYLKTLSVLIDAGAFIDANQNDFGGLAASQYSFTTAEAPDVSPPTFPSFTPPTTLNKGFGTSTPSVEIVDNKAVTSAKIFVRAISGTTFTEASGQLNTAGTKWDFTLSETLSDAIGVQYYFEAKDAAGNVGRSPAGTGYHQTYLKYATDLQIPDAVVGVGGKKADWKVIAIPFDLVNNGIATVFDELSTKTNQVDYRIITYKDNNAWAEYPSSELSGFNRGRGYFINLKSQIVLKLGTDLVPPANTRNDLFKISLKKGWNMIGNPYLTPISWADVVTFNTTVTGLPANLRQYIGGNYTNNNSLSAFTGGFVLVNADMEVSIPFLGQTTPGGRAQQPEEFLNDDWLLPMTVTSGQVINVFAGVGMHSKALAGFDQFDDVNSPHFIDFVDVNFSHPEHFEKNFSRDVIPTQSEYVWEFAIESNLTGNTEIAWDNSKLLSQSKSIFLLDVSTKNVIDMKKDSRYVFSSAGSNKFKVIFGAQAFVDKNLDNLRLSITTLYPVPSPSSVNIGFNVPQSKTRTAVQIKVTNMLGQVMDIIYSGEIESGYHEIIWSGSDRSGNRVPQGVYAVSVSSAANSDTKQLIMK